MAPFTPLELLLLTLVFALSQKQSFCSTLKSEEGLALLALRERVVSDPLGALSSWSGEDGDIDPCSWFGVECFHGYVVTL